MSEHILIVEDEEKLSNLMSDFLMNHHFNTCLLYTSDAADE